MKILINAGMVISFFTKRLDLIESIKSYGFDVTLSGYQEEYSKKCQNLGVNFLQIPFSRAGLNPVSDLKLILAYYRDIKKNNYDIVHSYTVKPNIYGSIAAKLAGVKKIYPTVNGLGYAFTDKESKSIKDRMIRFAVSVLYKISFSFATKVFFQNKDDAEEMIKHRIVKRNKCVVVAGSGIDLEQYPFADCRNDKTVFLLASRLLITKGIRTYAESASIVKKEYPNAIFQLAGALDPNPDGIKQSELQSYIDEGAIEYMGEIKDMRKAFADCSVFVLPSYYREGVPHAILEAMSTGRAIITSDSPGCKETVNGKNGFLVNPRNVEELANKMRWMIENTDSIIQMGIESRKYAKEKFDVKKVNNIIMKTMKII